MEHENSQISFFVFLHLLHISLFYSFVLDISSFFYFLVVIIKKTFLLSKHYKNPP